MTSEKLTQWRMHQVRSATARKRNFNCAHYYFQYALCYCNFLYYVRLLFNRPIFPELLQSGL